MTEQLSKFADGVLEAVNGYLRRALAPLQPLPDRVAVLEKRQPERGEKGDVGEKGMAGAPGIDGKDGAPGRDGVDGAKGDPGEKGEKGDPGAPGAKGDPAEPAEKGDPGEPGPQGDPGEPGAEGAKGLDGAPGVDGRNGIDGKDGAPGLVGKNGEPGERGLPGIDGAPGRDGTDGRDGLAGKDGDPGRDGLQIEILPAIDAAKAYPRGTWARHAGGLWRSFGTTEAMKGWECIMNGLARIEVEDVDDRTTIERHVLSDGSVFERKRVSHEQIYRNIWKEGAYRHGDTVTRDGCQWHANVDTIGQPGASDDWQMCVKKGRDGKDGLRGEKGERGAEGRAGKDLTQMGPDGRKW